MRFFTPAWHRGDLSDDESEAVMRRYTEHITSLATTLPSAMRELAMGLNLHDGRVGRVVVDRRRRRVSLTLRIGDQQSGYSNLQLRYDSVALSRLDTRTLRAVVEDPASELLYDEVDRSDHGRFIHRMLFIPYRDVEIDFEQLSIAREACADRSTELGSAEYVEKGVAAV
jgi:hypothetical protein